METQFTLNEIAKVFDSVNDEKTRFRVVNRPSMILAIQKQPGAILQRWWMASKP